MKLRYIEKNGNFYPQYLNENFEPQFIYFNTYRSMPYMRSLHDFLGAEMEGDQTSCPIYFTSEIKVLTFMGALSVFLRSNFKEIDFSYNQITDNQLS